MFNEAAVRTVGPKMRTSTDRERQIIALRLAGPMRACTGRATEAQRDAGHLPLFVAANEPRLF